MEKKMKTKICQSDKDKFSVNAKLFLEEFEFHFIEYFVSLCVSYDCAIDKSEAKVMASSIYKNIFKCDFDSAEFQEDLFVKMRQDGVMVGFLVTRSLFYMIEKYMEFAKRKKITPRIEILMLCINRFINLLENKISKKYAASVVRFDFDTSDVMLPTYNTIIELFRKIQEEEQTVTFLNLYQGVPISYEAKIVNIEGENISFSMDKLQEIAMKLDGNAFIIKNDYFGKHIKADIVYSNFLTNTVTLNNFIYLLNMPALQREFVRVHPDIIAKVYLYQDGAVQTSGRLYDLSMNGLGVVSSNNNGIVVGSKVVIDFQLNDALHTNAKEKIEVSGEVLNIIEYKGSYRYCMQIFPQKEMSDRIISYINQREKDILENLKDELKDYIV